MEAPVQTRAWTNGSGTYGLRVGARNRDRFFKREWEEALLEIDGETHRVRITGGFWKDCPELRAPIIRDWLREHRTLKWPKGQPPTVELIPLGENRFRVDP